MILPFILIVIFVLLLVYITCAFDENVYVKSTYDNKNYLIRRGKSKSDDYLVQSANALAIINERVIKLINHLTLKYKNDMTKHFIVILANNYNSNILSEAAFDKRYTTFTVDKQDMHICLRTRDANEHLYDINTLMYVILHELAHFCNYNQHGVPIQGHGPEFKQIFRLLVVEAIDIGVYQYKNYSTEPQEYCGLIINSSIL
jgi:predicted SprT family Zn-dependent metalloprotease